jgi:hypothetical protein
LDLRFQSLSLEIATRHSSHGGEFDERIDPSRMRSTGLAGASKARVLDRIESASPIMLAVR